VWTGAAHGQLRFSPELIAVAPDAPEIPPELSVVDELPAPTDGESPDEANHEKDRQKSDVTTDDSTFQTRDTAHDETELWEEGTLPDGHFDYLTDSAILESSGTWFRRGFWYTRQDVVLYQLDNYKDKIIAVDRSFTLLRPRILGITSGVGGLSANARLTLGRFLYRDAKNRDHTAEFTYMGPGKWTGEARTQSELEDQLLNAFDLFAPGFGSLTFGGVNEMSYFYESRLNSYEWNYRLQRRLKRDLLVLDQDGQWKREMKPELLYGYLFGVRWVNLDEEFDLRAQAVLRDAGGTALVSTNNDLVGFQIGGEAIYQHERWSLDVLAKAGPYVNFAGRTITVDAHDVDPATSDPVTLMIDDRADLDVIGFVGEVGIHATYYAKPNLSFRVGFEALWVNSLSLALRELQGADYGQVSPVESINTAGGLQYMGFSTGMEYHW